ncbi:hypothetical protein MASR2M8_26610 [Opitutaceae bacterium]
MACGHPAQKMLGLISCRSEVGQQGLANGGAGIIEQAEQSLARGGTGLVGVHGTNQKGSVGFATAKERAAVM